MRFIKNSINKYILDKMLDLGHKPAEKPKNEQSRLEDLKELQLIEKNIEKDKRFSSFPKLAATITGCEQAAINILDDDTQHCIVSYGNDIVEKVMTKEIPRDISVCSHVVNNDSKPIIINDLTKDDRTKHMFELNNSFISNSFPKFYAGSPIITSKGYTLGAFCVTNPEPKSLEQEKIDGLRMLADQFINLFEHTNRPNDLIDTNNQNNNEKIEGEYYSSATVLFTDFVGFTKKTENLQPGDLIEILDSFFSGFDKIINRFELKKVKTIGDAYMAVGGIPDLNSNHPERSVLAAKEMINFVKGINFQQKSFGNEPWFLRVGVHTGPVIAGSTSSHFDIWGDTVNTAARLESSGEEMKVHISGETKSNIPENIPTIFKEGTKLKDKGIHNTFIVLDD
tara:strand:+ start:88 stop:1275 length:1188 start_codon:yes stop_codon:yes gene_type:complete